MAIDLRGSLPSGQRVRFRRLLPWLMIPLFMLLIHYHTLIKDSFIRNALPGVRLSKPGPLHVLLLSYARTGSSFVGELLAEMPSTFYYFEPIHFLSSPVLNGSEINRSARQLLRNVFRCNVSAAKGFMAWQKEHQKYMKLKRSQHYWSNCSTASRNKKFPALCYNATYMDSYCTQKEVVVVKTIRLKLPEAISLLDDPDLNLKIIYLMRDPRGSHSSRIKYPISAWCRRDKLCVSSKAFCESLEEDQEIICPFLQERPQDLLVLRYEDIAIHPFQATERVVHFLGYDDIPQEVNAFLRSHTEVKGKVKKGDKSAGVAYPYDTFRNSSITASSWRREFSFKYVLQLQRHCRSVLDFFGYHSYSTQASLKSNVDYDIAVDLALQESCASQ